jgi:hypothetical protein
MPSYRMLRRVALVRNDVSEERLAFFIRMTRMGELESTFIRSVFGLIVNANRLVCRILSA